MREILFRGKRKHDGEWVHGYYLVKTDPLLKSKMHFILVQDSNSGFLTSLFSWNVVDSETVWQFTGLTDKNGTKIFEGDIVHVHDCLLKPSAPYHEFDGVIEHRNGSFVIVGELMTHYRWLDYDVTVLGNIHDNPELLEVENGKAD